MYAIKVTDFNLSFIDNNFENSQAENASKFFAVFLIKDRNVYDTQNVCTCTSVCNNWMYMYNHGITTNRIEVCIWYACASTCTCTQQASCRHKCITI